MEQFIQFGNRRSKTRKVIVTCISVLLFVVFLFTTNGSNIYLETTGETDEESVECVAVSSPNIVIEASSGRVLTGLGIHQRMEPASTTKILTAIVVLENMSVEDYVIVPKEATLTEGSSIYLKAGEKWKIKDLLYGLMLRSGNDAAVTLALALGGIEKFALLMNMTALKAGAYNSNFVNPHGLHDDNHYTTAYDLAKITAYAYRNEEFVKIVSTEKYAYDYLNEERRVFTNKNKLLFVFDGANGVKTGFTKKSGRCLVFGAKRNDMQLISVVLNEPDMWQKSASLMETCFSEYQLIRVLSKDDIKEIDYADKTISVHVKNDLYYPMKENEIDNLKYEYTIKSNVKNLTSRLEIGSISIKLVNHLIFFEKLYIM